MFRSVEGFQQQCGIIFFQICCDSDYMTDYIDQLMKLLILNGTFRAVIKPLKKINMYVK